MPTKMKAASDGRGFVVAEDEVVGQTHQGRQVLNPAAPTQAQVCIPVVGDAVAVNGTIRKMIIFESAELPEMSRGRDVILQRYRDGELADIKTFARSGGLTPMTPSGHTYTETELLACQGKHGAAGRLAPRGFNRSNRLG